MPVGEVDPRHKHPVFPAHYLRTQEQRPCPTARTRFAQHRDTSTLQARYIVDYTSEIISSTHADTEATSHTLPLAALTPESDAAKPRPALHPPAANGELSSQCQYFSTLRHPTRAPTPLRTMNGIASTPVRTAAMQGCPSIPAYCQQKRRARSRGSSADR